MNPVSKALLTSLLFLLVSDAAFAVALSLDEAVGTNKRGAAILFALEVRATFDYDVDKEELSSSGTWIAQNRTGPSLLIRYSHKVENFSVSIANGIFMKSYECVEGTFGATILINYCNNYRFGKNQTDDGGYVDDLSTGLNLSMYYYEAAKIDWDGSTLTVMLVPKSSIDIAALPELGITLVFSVSDEETSPPAP